MRHSTEFVCAAITRSTVWHRLLNIRWRTSDVGRLWIWIAALVLVLGHGAYAQVATPNFVQPASGVLSPTSGFRPFSVKITCTTPNATIRYTTDGSEPTIWSQSVGSEGSVEVKYNLRLKAKAWDTSGKSSATASTTCYISHAVAAGSLHSMAFDYDGRLLTWGKNTDGRLGLGNIVSPQHSPLSRSPQPLLGVIDIDGGAEDGSNLAHSVLLKNDGTVWSAGSGASGRLGDGTQNNSTNWVQVKYNAATLPAEDLQPLTNVRAVAAGLAASYALTENGEVYSWGLNSATAPRLGRNLTGDLVTRWGEKVVKSDGTPLTQVLAIAAGDNHAIALCDDGTVWAWGSNDVGQIGNNGGASAHSPYAVQVQAGDTDTSNPGAPLTGIVAIATGNTHSLALTSSGTVVGWGESANGRLGNGTAPSTSTPKRRPIYVKASGTLDFTDVQKIATGGTVSLFIKSNGELWACGGNGQHQLGDGTTTNRGNPVRVKTNSTTNLSANIIDAAAGAGHCIALTSTGKVYTWGMDTSGQIGNGSSTSTDVIYATNIVSNLSNFDSDEDGIPDAMELSYAGNLTSFGGVDGSGNPRDTDGDGLTDAEEFLFGTMPTAANQASASSGNWQAGPANGILAQQLVRSIGRPIGGVPVIFTVTSGGGKVSASGAAWQTSVTAYTDAFGVARAYWQLGKHGSTANTLSSLIGSGPLVNFTSQSNDLVARWKLDEGAGTAANDSSGTGYNAGVHVKPLDPTEAPNYPGYPRDTSFDGSGSIKTTGRNTAPDSTIIWHPNAENEVIEQTGPFTISFWFKADTLTPGILNWLANCEQTGVSGFRLGIDTGAFQQAGNRVMFWTTQSGGNVFLIAPTPIVAKRWYNLSIVHTGSETQMYIDWSLVASAPGSIQRGTNPITFASCAAGAYELNGEIDDIKVYTAAVPPVPSLEVAHDDRLMMEIPFAMTLEAISEKPTKGTANGAGRILLYKPYELSRSIDRFTYDLTTSGEKVTMGVNITGPQGGVSAKPRYQRTVIVHQGTTKQFDLEIDNPDGHPVTITPLGWSASVVDWRPDPNSQYPQPPEANFIGTATVGVGSFPENPLGGVHITYQTPNASARGEVRFRYRVRDGITFEESEGTVVIHVVRPVYLSSTQGDTAPSQIPDRGNDINHPYLVSSQDEYTNLIAPGVNSFITERYTVYYYEPGIYKTKGSKPSAYRFTANDGCKHYHVKYSPDYTGPACPDPVTVKLVDAGISEKQDGGTIFASGGAYNTHGFEVRGLTLDGNPDDNPLFNCWVTGGITCSGSNIIISNTTFIRFGGINTGVESFPLMIAGGPLWYTGGPLSEPLPPSNGYSLVAGYDYENILVEDCTVEKPAHGSTCMFTAISVVPVQKAALSNAVVRRCVVRGFPDSASLRVQGCTAPLVEDCTFEGPKVAGIYLEPNHKLPIDYDVPYVFRRNKFRNVYNGLAMNFLTGGAEQFASGVTFEDNLVMLSDTYGSSATAIGQTTVDEIPGTDAYINELHVHGNVVRTFQDGVLPNETETARISNTGVLGLYLSFCTTNVNGELDVQTSPTESTMVKSIKSLHVDCSENVIRLDNQRELGLRFESTADAFQKNGFPTLYNNFRSIDDSAPQLLPVVADKADHEWVTHPTISQLPE